MFIIRLCVYVTNSAGLDCYYKKRVLDITNSECLLTICLACEGLSFDLAAIAVNSTSFFNVSMFELRDLMVCLKKTKQKKNQI